MLTVALAKGALLKDSIRLFQSIGLDFSAFLEPGMRQLQIEDPTGRARALILRNGDVPVYVEYGQAHLGIVGYDVLQEKRANVAQLVDLGFGGCRMSVAVKQTSPYRSARDFPAHVRVASKFVGCARAYFHELDIPVELIYLSGSVELGPITGMSEAIVDLVATGTTLRENGLQELEVLFESTARLVGHPLSYRLNQDGMGEIVANMRQQVMVP
ncbi:MAG: ATP phosphoribosyltransferase [Synechococcales cyanobacterium RM1_1_8]|nr:ATP phosphoribosyltransferase [Synechococcales cyanobacterium RM1_1_8]